VTFYAGPIVDVTVEAKSARAAQHGVQLVMAETETQLAKLQASTGSPRSQFIGTQTVVPATPATRLFSSTLRRLIAVAVLDFLLILFSAGIAEAIATRRSRREAAANGTGPVAHEYPVPQFTGVAPQYATATAAPPVPPVTPQPQPFPVAAAPVVTQVPQPSYQTVAPAPQPTPVGAAPVGVGVNTARARRLTESWLADWPRSADRFGNGHAQPGEYPQRG
jgi:hypothetical protein